MTKDEFISKIKEMLPDLNNLILEKANKALNSGAFDLEDYDDNFLLPKIFMSAMGKEIEWQYKPHNKRDTKVRNNLSNFL